MIGDRILRDIASNNALGGYRLLNMYKLFSYIIIISETTEIVTSAAADRDFCTEYYNNYYIFIFLYLNIVLPLNTPW